MVVCKTIYFNFGQRLWPAVNKCTRTRTRGTIYVIITHYTYYLLIDSLGAKTLKKSDRKCSRLKCYSPFADDALSAQASAALAASAEGVGVVLSSFIAFIRQL